ncbi:MAG: DUF4166 domain-containing protein [Alphaproteobacteria bacterium]|nr:DUF4166 domain-containing protein [Alphaproteobacteria bacterium]
MTEASTEKAKEGVWFVYDGDCPICKTAAHALQIRKAVGALHLVNARQDKDHPLLQEINDRRLDLDEGMVLKYRDGYYHGEDALHMMALLGSGHGWFNKMNALLFRSKKLARLCYPAMRATRNALLRFKGVRKIRNLEIDPQEPLFKTVFGAQWDALPPVMKKHYAVRPFSDDVVTVEGHLDVRISPMVSVMARLTGMLLAYSGKNVPVTVVFRSDQSGAFQFDRTFHFPEKGDVAFRSRMEWIEGNVLVEFMRFGIGWKLAYEWDGEKIILRHRGYVWRILGVMMPLPMSLVIGKGHAEEAPLSEDAFSMWTHALHPLFGKTFGYAGKFRVTQVSGTP